MMTLEEAIKHAEEVAETNERMVRNGVWERGSFTEKKCISCAAEHRQLADWLKELKSLREHKSKTGKWIKCIDDEGFTLPYKNCSECGEIGVLRMNFCPNCGLKMER